MANILNLEEVKAENEGKEYMGLVCITNRSTRPKKTGGDYMTGTMQMGKTSVSFKVWDATVIDLLKTAGETNYVVYVNGKVDVYNGFAGFVITYVDCANPEIAEVSKADFLSTLDTQTLQTTFKAYTEKVLTPRSKELVEAIFAKDYKGKNIGNMYMVGYAATKHHDNQPCGLINHTYKMMRTLDMLYLNDKRIAPYMELLRLGIVLHDLGKVIEMYDGAYTVEGAYLSHIAYSEEYLLKALNEDAELNAAWSEQEILQLRAIIRGHHGEYGEPCKTVLSYFVHLIDMLDAEFTGILDMLDNVGAIKEMTQGVKSIYVRDKYLTI